MGKRSVALISGGLDSILAARIMIDQGFEILGIFCTSAFSKSYGREDSTPAAIVAKSVGIDLRVIDLGQEYIDLIRSPHHGYGKNSNPCIDCKIFMLSKARKIMEEIGASFVITGEVLGQRPMSQRRDTLQVIEREAGLRGRILRPLSATHLPPTLAEQEGLVERGKLLGISGRGRTVQLQLADRFSITGFSAPAGGCLLTDKNFSDKLRDLFVDQERITPADIQLLTVGRHFRFQRGLKVILGRNLPENQVLLSLASGGYHLFLPHGYPGPVALLAGSPDAGIKQAIGRLILTYSKPVPGMTRRVRFGNEIIDPGDPLPVNELGITRVGTDH